MSHSSLMGVADRQLAVARAAHRWTRAPLHVIARAALLPGTLHSSRVASRAAEFFGMLQSSIDAADAAALERLAADCFGDVRPLTLVTCTLAGSVAMLDLGGLHAHTCRAHLPTGGPHTSAASPRLLSHSTVADRPTGWVPIEPQDRRWVPRTERLHAVFGPLASLVGYRCRRAQPLPAVLQVADAIGRVCGGSRAPLQQTSAVHRTLASFRAASGTQ